MRSRNTSCLLLACSSFSIRNGLSFFCHHHQRPTKILQYGPGCISIQSSTPQHSVRCFASSQLDLLDSSNNNNKDDDDDDEKVSPETLNRWEQMYQQGETAKQELLRIMSDSLQEDGTEFVSQQQPSPIRVITFDLDNTLWKTSGTINAANDALADHLLANNITVSRRIEKVMGDLFQQNPKRYCPQCTEQDHHEDCCKAPVLLTQLRTDAIYHVLETENGFSADQAKEFAEAAFDVWTNARHDAILENLARDVIPTLRHIRASLHEKLLVGAITDGNSNPTRVADLEPYFDFVINAEFVGVAKPNKEVYLEAVRTIVTHEHFSEVLPTDVVTVDTTDMELLETLVGPYWVHIGDDFLKDIVAAKNMKMRTIWALELISDKALAKNGDSSSSSSPMMTMEDFVKTVSSQTVVSLGIGADDYLASSLTGEFVDAVAESFSDIGRILSEWHTEGHGIMMSSDSGRPPEETTVVAKEDPIPKNLTTDPPFTALSNDKSDGGVDFVVPRAFRIVRDNCLMDVPAPLKDRSDRTMKDVMSMAQLDKSSGVFNFSAEDSTALQAGTKTLMIQIGDLTFSKDIFSALTVEEVLLMTDENPVVLSFSLKEIPPGGQALDLF
ncbi:haloacid dehalogenase-like hydrolase [Nitzschia inconspicua]|uniref:Haloacid dehalogenase-like hydrolase n=1 Tax=Nitzschia inconspicua TaxID=303405 RepID=A0A9K3Q5C8_9STRA|nr:haloacid dehalogenase-like hydrolase [Nitzschia inconspicua]